MKSGILEIPRKSFEQSKSNFPSLYKQWKYSRFKEKKMQLSLLKNSNNFKFNQICKNY